MPPRSDGSFEKNDWEQSPGRVDTRRVYTGRVISLDVDTVQFPNGTTGELEMIRHSGASAVVPFLDDPATPDPQILLIRQYRYAAEGYLYEIPAGRLDRGEAPEDCARRELREETGYECKNVTRLTTIYTTPGFTDERIHLFMASGLKSGEASLEADEILDVHSMRLSRILTMIESGELQDGKSIVALLLAARAVPTQ
ncbi:MAG TPA: NUDIX hydrolase [Gemmatimonadaceae bacterium]|nr:NUDIX hydrolase [Gemmatimonadaceae bacterium]